MGKLTNYSNINLTEQNINIPEKYRLDNKTTPETTETTDATETTETAEATETTEEATTVEDNKNSYLYGDSDNFNDENVDIKVIKTVTSNEKFHVNSDYIYI